jgi:hypothetical protein
MDTLFYSSGKAALVLGVTQEHIRDLCSTGTIAAQSSNGGQWRIGKAEVERLKRDGLPPLARALPGHNARPPAAGHGLFAKPSEQVIAAAEEVVVLQNEVTGLGLRRQKEEALDWFREREELEAERLAAEQEAELERAEAERQRQAREKAERQREVWLQSWERYALHALPSDLDPQVRLQVHETVRQRLQKLQPTPPGDVTKQVVDAEIQKALSPWRRKQQIEQVIRDAVDQLPYQAKAYYEPTAWQIRATQLARQAVRGLDADAAPSEVEVAARQVVEAIAGEFRAQKDAEADAQLRAQVLNLAPLPVELNDKGRQLARAAILEALELMPQGTSYADLAKVRDAAIVPFQQLVDTEREREAEAQRKQAEQAQQERRVKSQREDQERVQQAKIQQEQAEEARAKRDREQEEARKLAAAKSRVSWRLLSDVSRYLQDLERQGEIEFEGRSDQWDLERKLEDKIGPLLVQELVRKPDLTDAQIQERIETLADEHLDTVLAA